jgi:hypothetical protein
MLAGHRFCVAFVSMPAGKGRVKPAAWPTASIETCQGLRSPFAIAFCGMRKASASCWFGSMVTFQNPDGTATWSAPIVFGPHQLRAVE